METGLDEGYVDTSQQDTKLRFLLESTKKTSLLLSEEFAILAVPTMTERTEAAKK